MVFSVIRQVNLAHPACMSSGLLYSAAVSFLCYFCSPNFRPTVFVEFSGLVEIWLVYGLTLVFQSLETLPWWPIFGPYSTFIQCICILKRIGRNSTPLYALTVTIIPLNDLEIWCSSFGAVTPEFMRLGCVFGGRDSTTILAWYIRQIITEYTGPVFTKCMAFWHLFSGRWRWHGRPNRRNWPTLQCTHIQSDDIPERTRE